MFTVRFTAFGTGVYVGEPEAIRALFTGDQSDLLAGEANSIMEPVLGPRSVLVLDGPEHLRQRKLLLPPIRGTRVTGFRSVIREIAEREVASWRPGERFKLRARMRGLTFEVICRVVFGVADPVRVQRLREAFGAVLDSSTLYMKSKRRAPRGPRGGAEAPAGGWRPGCAPPMSRCCLKRSPGGAPSPTSSGAATCSRCCCVSAR